MRSVVAVFLTASAIGCVVDNDATEKSDAASRRALEALPYASWTDVDGDATSGVVAHDDTRASAGLNLYVSLARTSAVLIDMDGNELHRWARDSGREWGHVELLPNRDLLVLNEDPRKLMRLDWDSNVIWESHEQVHHDVDVDENGDIYVLTASNEQLGFGGEPLPIRDHAITRMGPDGRVKERVAFSEILADQFDETALREFVATGQKIGERFRRMGEFVDLFHTNTLALVPRRFSETFQEGFVLFAARNLNLIGVVDLESRALVWSWGQDELDWPHQPALMDSGNLLVFDNGFHRGYSRVLEVDPSTGDIVWSYVGDPPESFRSRTMGGVQSLANGNVLVTESLKGHAFEITREGEIVWEFFNPDVNDNRDKRATIYRMERLPLDYLD